MNYFRLLCTAIASTIGGLAILAIIISVVVIFAIVVGALFTAIFSG